jgi:hypothetical protein
VLDDIGDVNASAINACVNQDAVEQPPRRSHERLALSILLVSGLLTYQHHIGVHRPLAEDRLGRSLIEIASRARGRVTTQAFKGGARSYHRRVLPRW